MNNHNLFLRKYLALFQKKTSYLTSPLSLSKETILKLYYPVRSAFCNTSRRSYTNTGHEMSNLRCNSAMHRLLQMKNEGSNLIPLPDLFDAIHSFEQFIITIKKV